MSTNEFNDLSQFRFPIRRPVTTAMIFLTLAVFGWKSYQDLPINLMPDISYPTLTVRTEFEGAAPEDVEKLLTRPLEETLSIVSGMEEISSTSSAGLSEVVLEFKWDTEMSVAMQEVRDRLDLYEPPPDVTQKPIILRYDPTLDPVMRVAITGPPMDHINDIAKRREEDRRNLTEIRDIAERQIKNDLEGETGIAEVEVKGGIEEQIQIFVDSQRLNNLGLSIDAVSSALSAQNINYTGGRLVDGKTEYLVRTLNEYADVSDIPMTVIPNPANPEGPTLRLRDIANVVVGGKDRETIVRINGREAVEMAIYKWGDSNTVQVCDMLKDAFGFPREKGSLEKMLDRMATGEGGMPMAGAPAQFVMMQLGAELEEVQNIRSQLPRGTELTLISDQSRFITAAISEVQNTAVTGGILALIILYFFLRELKTTVIVGIAIPISIVATFIPMFMRDISLNIMSLGGLALGVGMLVDNSIVVLESIARCSEEGDDTVDAANRGTNEVASAVTASTLTTVCVFLPIAFVEGIAGQVFSDQALTVTFSLLASLLSALFLIPMIASRQHVQRRATREVVWMVGAYHHGRDQGKGVLESILSIPWEAMTMASEWLVSTAERNYGPTLTAARRTWSFATRDVWRRMNGSAVYLVIGLIVFIIIVFAVTLIFSSAAVAVTVTMAALAAILILPPLAFAAALAVPMILTSLMFGIQVVLNGIGQAFITFAFMTLAMLFGMVRLIGKVLGLLLAIPLAVFDYSFNALRNGYTVSLRYALRFSPAILALVAILAVHSFYVASSLGRELIPSLKQGEFGIRMEAPSGTRLEETEKRARTIETLAMAFEDVESVAVKVGQDSSDDSGTRGENMAEFTVQLRNPNVTARYQDQIIQSMRDEITPRTSDEITFTLPSLFSFKTAVELQIRGDGLDEIRRIGEAIIERSSDIEGLEDLELNMQEGYPEIIIRLDNDKLAALGITPDAVASRIQQELAGSVPTRLNRRGEKIDIRVQTDESLLHSLDDLKALVVSDGTPSVPLEAVAFVSVTDGPSEIRRTDQRRVGVITGNVTGRDLGTVTSDLMARANEVSRPPDYEIDAGGQNRELETSLGSLRFALLLAIFLVYVVMASQFESIWHPAIVMFCVPLAFVGVIYVLAYLGIDLSIVVYIGGIILAGIVVNNGIVLVDYINQLRARGIPKREAVVQAGSVRLRPIIMTTLTTVLGLVPMAMSVGEGAEIRMPMAVTVMAGLTSATVLTLVIIPMVYDLFGGRDPA
jgi:hydrophobic/amphiphilic exporter-1 (mainly G- bacteria), HAE1 family